MKLSDNKQLYDYFASLGSKLAAAGVGQLSEEVASAARTVSSDSGHGVSRRSSHGANGVVVLENGIGGRGAKESATSVSKFSWGFTKTGACNIVT